MYDPTRVDTAPALAEADRTGGPENPASEPGAHPGPSDTNATDGDVKRLTEQGRKASRAFAGELPVSLLGNPFGC